MLALIAFLGIQAELRPLPEHELKGLVERVMLESGLVDVTEYFGSNGQYVREVRGMLMHGTYTVSGDTLCRQASAIPIPPTVPVVSPPQCFSVLTDGEGHFFLADPGRGLSQTTEVRFRPILNLP